MILDYCWNSLMHIITSGMGRRQNDNEMQNYRIGEVAKILGITVEGVRFLERNGLIHSHRNEENNYRYYDRVEVIELEQIQMYQKLGFTLKEGQQLIHDKDISEIQSMLEERQKSLLVEMEQLQQKLKRNQEYLNSLHEASEQKNSAGYMEDEALYFLPLAGALAPVNEDLVEAECQWLQPGLGTSLARIVMDEHGNACNEKGLLARESVLQERKLPLYDWLVKIEHGMYCELVMERALFHEKPYAGLYSQCKKDKRTVRGPMISEILITYNQDGVRSNLEHIWIPVM